MPKAPETAHVKAAREAVYAVLGLPDGASRISPQSHLVEIPTLDDETRVVEIRIIVKKPSDAYTTSEFIEAEVMKFQDKLTDADKAAQEKAEKIVRDTEKRHRVARKKTAQELADRIAGK